MFGAVNNLSIKAKLYAGFGLLVALCLCLAGFGLVQLSAIKSSTDSMEIQSANALRAATAGDLIQQIRRNILRIVYDQDARAYADIPKTTADLTALMQEAERATRAEDRRKAYRDLQERFVA